MAKWGINAIRLPMNEDCWLGVNGANPKTSGAIYQSTFVTFVEQLLAAGFVVVLDLHWTSHTTGVRATACADMIHAPLFAGSVQHDSVNTAL
jgi:endoglucanase